MHSNYLVIKNKLISLKKINVDGDKSLSIRWVLLASQAIGISKRAKKFIKIRGCIEAYKHLKN